MYVISESIVMVKNTDLETLTDSPIFSSREYERVVYRNAVSLYVCLDSWACFIHIHYLRVRPPGVGAR
jgi:hypothetical protein